MKNNAGISLTSENSILYYSNLYLSAFEQCEIYASWEPQGEYIKHISQSHSYMLHTYPNKQRFWAYNFDIFHYIYNNPWTWALQNKRILLISPFEETLKTQIENRKYILCATVCFVLSVNRPTVDYIYMFVGCIRPQFSGQWSGVQTHNHCSMSGRYMQLCAVTLR